MRYALLSFLVVTLAGCFVALLRRRKKAQAAAVELARIRAEFAPAEARAALTEWILKRSSVFTLDEAMAELSRPMTRDEVAAVCATLSLAVPSLRGLLPAETLQKLPPSKPRLHSTVHNGARVTSLRPPETMRMTRAEYLAWQRDQGRSGS